MSDSNQDQDLQRRVLTNVDAIRAPADAISLLDVYLLRERDWHNALDRQSVFRMPSFKPNYEGLVEALVEAEDNGFPDEREVEDKFRREAVDVASKLINSRKPGTKPWSDATFGRNQVEYAINGNPMRFEKVVIAALAFNRFSMRHGLLERFSIQNHSVVACCFYFSNLYRIIEAYAGCKVQDHDAFEGAAEEIAGLIGQSTEVVKALAGERAADLQTQTKEKAVTHLGSFPTLVAILQALAPKVKEARDALGEAKDPLVPPNWALGPAVRPNFPKFEKLIIRRRQKMSPPKTMNDEIINPFGRVTWGPYAWPEEPEAAYPKWPQLIET